MILLNLLRVVPHLPILACFVLSGGPGIGTKVYIFNVTWLTYDLPHKG